MSLMSSVSITLFLGLFVVACGGGGSGPTEQANVLATAPIDLPPGQTTAQLAWKPSDGQVVGYLVFQSRGEENFRFLSMVTEPEIQISGQPGDSIRILVVAEGVESAESEASFPSPPIRFSAAVEVVSALTTRSPEKGVTATVAIVATPASSSNDLASTDSEAQSIDSESSAVDVAEGAETQADPNRGDQVALLDQSLRERLLGSDTRFSSRSLSPGASRWIQSFVDAQVGAGVSLAGGGELGGDGLRDLVWIDRSGQLFVSDGASITTTDDLPGTFVEAIRLRPTERFAGLADFDGDGSGEWIIEDAATGDVWIVNGESQEARFALDTALNPDLRLVGQGDFNGDGRTELLWQHTDSSFQLGDPTANPTLVEWTRPEEDSNAAGRPTSQLLTVADLNGDGRDDLLLRGSDGLLELALSTLDSSGLRFERMQGPETATEGLELIATVDLDRDGSAEIAWWSDAGLEIWDAQTGI